MTVTIQLKRKKERKVQVMQYENIHPIPTTLTGVLIQIQTRRASVGASAFCQQRNVLFLLQTSEHAAPTWNKDTAVVKSFE